MTRDSTDDAGDDDARIGDERDDDSETTVDDRNAVDGNLSEDEIAALHEVELGVEWLHRAHGHLVQFHHATGHAMDHFADAEPLLRASGHEELADRLRAELLPRGVLDDTWSYGVLEAFQSGCLSDVATFETETRESIADGARHVAERRQEREWKERAEK